ncbi:hypothetical protein FF1_002420 [Malus domestica]
MGFCDAWVNIVMCCVSSVQFSVHLNGQPGKSFKPLRGLRQGDPLSPYLFLIVSEVISRLLKRATDIQFLDGIQINANCHRLTHLLFTDDTLVFLKATPDNCRNLSSLLKAYYKASGQQVSLQKSTVYFSANTSVALAHELSGILEMTVVEDPGTYLGVPTMWGRLKRDALAFIKERVLAKILGWKQQFLSQVSSIFNGRSIPTDGGEINKTRVVASIIDTERRTWSEDEIRDLFSESAGAAISRIHIGDSCSPDHLFWPASKTNAYSVKLGYWWLRNSIPVMRLDHPSTSHSILPQEWAGIWKLWVPPKVKFFLWRCVRGAIATRENLFKRMSAENPCCLICLLHSESVEHMLLLCPWVQPVWFGGPLCIRIIGASISSFDDWLSHLFSLQLGSSESKSSTWEAFADANSRIHGLAPSPRNNHLCEVSWSPPPPSVLKINVDVSWRHGASSAWVGLVIHDSSRRCLEVRMMKVLASSAAMAESLVVLEGRLLAKGLNFPRVVIESDSKLVTSCLQDCSSSCAWELFPIQDRVFGWLGRLSKLAPGLGFQDQQTVRRTSL